MDVEDSALFFCQRRWFSAVALKNQRQSVENRRKRWKRHEFFVKTVGFALIFRPLILRLFGRLPLYISGLCSSSTINSTLNDLKLISVR